MTRCLTAAVIAVAALAIACSSTTTKELPVRTQYDRDTAFGEWKSFRMASRSTTDPGYTRYPRYERVVREALEEELVSRGYERADDGQTDFRVDFELIFRGRTDEPRQDRPAAAEAVPATASGAGQTSTLIVRMLHPTTAQVLWEGKVSGFGVDSVEPNQKLRKAVWRVLVEFPPITG